MKLTIGITALQPQWQLLLNQIGVSLSPLGNSEEISPDNFGAIIVTARGNAKMRKPLLSYLHSGGSLLMETAGAEWLLDIPSKRRYIDYIQPANNSLYRNVLPGFVDTSLLVPEKANELLANDHFNLVQIIHEGKGSAIILPGGLASTVLSYQIRRRQFPSVSRFLPTERVARCTKHTIREIIQQSLIYLFSQRDLPFASLHPFPNGKPALFNLRIDTDFADRAQVSSVYDLCREHNIPATWFVETGSNNSQLSPYAAMKNQEIGLHCYKHKVFKKYRESEIDTKKGKLLLTKEKIAASGYAAPFGAWNPQAARAVENIGFQYSSEFGLDYDDHPFFPWLGNRFSSVLQLPVHPLSTARLTNAWHNTEEMKKYYRLVIETNLTHHLPLFIYDHPSSVNLHVLNWVIQWIKEQQIIIVTLGTYADWWHQRAQCRWQAEYFNGELLINSKRGKRNVWLSVVEPHGRIAATPLSPEVPLNKLTWQEPIQPPASVPMAVRNTISRKMITNSLDHILAKIKL